MNTRTFHFWFCTVTAVVGAVLMSSCANRGQGPQGGPKDETPPVVTALTPSNGATNVSVSQKRIDMSFNENVSVNDAFNNVVFSPPIKERPDVRASGKRLSVIFSDSLQANTSYTIDFGSAIVDYNESNPLENYVYSFSTGEVLDSMQIGGTVIDARTLAYVKGVSVGIYSDLSDTAFYKSPFERMTKSREEGKFKIYNIKEGSYSLFALNDASQRYCYADQFGVAVAFNDSLIRPDMHLHGTIDTLQYDAQDSTQNKLRINSFVEYYPNDIILKTFKETRTREYLRRSQRPTARNIVLAFGAKPTQEPKISLLDRDSLLVDSTANWYINEFRSRPDSCVYWITDSAVLANDTIFLRVEYLKSDSLYQLQAQADTLRLIVPRKQERRSRRQQENDSTKKVDYMEISHNFKNKMEVYDTIKLSFSEPLKQIDYEGIYLEKEVDSLMERVPVSVVLDDTVCTKSLTVFYKKDYGSKYKFSIDSASISGIYGGINNVFYKTYSLKELGEYANLYIRFPNPPQNAIVELLDANEKVVQTSTMDYEVMAVPFQDLAPGKYYVRMFIDENGNGKWDTGSIQERKQPETVYYYPKELSLRANWDVEEEWPYESIPLLEQRPKELREKDKTQK